MNQPLTVMLVFITGIFFTGDLLHRIFFRNIYHTNNIFLKISYAWLLGNFFFMLMTYVLAFNNKLDLIKPLYFYLLIGIEIAVYLYFLFKGCVKNYMAGLSEYAELVAILLFSIPLIIVALSTPLMAWDALAMWVMKAKTLFYYSGIWDNPLFKSPTFDYLSKAYPVGLPLLTSFYFRILGAVNDQVIQLYFLIFYISAIIAVYGFVVSIFKQYFLALLILILTLFSLPNMMIYSHNGYADLPISFVFLMGMISFIKLIEQKQIYHPYLMMILISAGFSATIKVEGYPYLAVMFLALTAYCIFQFMINKWNLRVLFNRRLIYFLFMLALILLPIGLWEYFKHREHLVLYLDYGTIGLRSVKKLQMIWFYYWQQITNATKYGIVTVPIIMFLIFINSFLTINKKFIQTLPTLVLLFQFGAYTYAYLRTPLPLVLQLQSSSERLLIQILPMMLVIVFYQFKYLLPKLHLE